MELLYEDNHIIIVNKKAGDIVQGDKTGDEPLVDKVKHYIKETYAKPGNVFLGVVHRLDRPVSGAVMFARTSKALSRLNEMFRNGEIHKTYWAIVENEKLRMKNEEYKLPRNTSQNKGNSYSSFFIPHSSLVTHYLLRNERQNKSYAYDHEVPGSKKAMLKYRFLQIGERYSLVEVNLLTGRHHQIRCQLAHIGMPIRGDIKYGARRSNPDGSISLCAHSIDFIHPVSKQHIHIQAPLPPDPLWQKLLPTS